MRHKRAVYRAMSKSDRRRYKRAGTKADGMRAAVNTLRQEIHRVRARGSSIPLKTVDPKFDAVAYIIGRFIKDELERDEAERGTIDEETTVNLQGESEMREIMVFPILQRHRASLRRGHASAKIRQEYLVKMGAKDLKSYVEYIGGTSTSTRKRRRATSGSSGSSASSTSSHRSERTRTPDARSTVAMMCAVNALIAQETVELQRSKIAAAQLQLEMLQASGALVELQ